MVLRILVLVLTLGNLGFYGWQEGWLDAVVRPRSIGDREPKRLQAQVDPQAMQLSNATATISAAPVPESSATANDTRSASSARAVRGVTSAAASSSAGVARSEAVPHALPTSSPASALSSASASAWAANTPAIAPPSASSAVPMAVMPGASAAPAPLACIQSGPYASREAAAAEALLKKALAPSAWVAVNDERAGDYMLFMGRYSDNESRVRKEGELKRRNARYEVVEAPPEYANGLSLGRFGSRADADKGLQELNRIGVHTARIVVVTPPVVQRTFRIDKADPAMVDKARSAGLPMPFAACVARTN